MTWRDKLELGLKGDAAFRKDNLPGNAAAEAGGDAQGNEGQGQSGPDKPADDGDPHSVPRQQLLAENTPSVLRQLRPMDISSDRMLRFLRTRQP